MFFGQQFDCSLRTDCSTKFGRSWTLICSNQVLTACGLHCLIIIFNGSWGCPLIAGERKTVAYSSAGMLPCSIHVCITYPYVNVYSLSYLTLLAGHRNDLQKLWSRRFFTSSSLGIGISFQLAITTPRLDLIGYGTATAQSWYSSPNARTIST